MRNLRHHQVTCLANGFPKTFHFFEVSRRDFSVVLLLGQFTFFTVGQRQMRSGRECIFLLALSPGCVASKRGEFSKNSSGCPAPERRVTTLPSLSLPFLVLLRLRDATPKMVRSKSAFRGNALGSPNHAPTSFLPSWPRRFSRFSQLTSRDRARIPTLATRARAPEKEGERKR